VFEHERTESDPIEFDFFDDAPTSEATRRDQEPPRRRPRIPQGPPGGGQPLLRLAGLIAGGILLVVVLVIWVNACREDQKKAQYEDYMSEVAKIGGDSAQIGANLNKLLFGSGAQIEDVQTQLAGLRDQQSQTVKRAESLDAPGPLREQQRALVEALQLRVSGLNGLAHEFDRVTGTETGDDEGKLLAQQSERLVASDVVYEDFFSARSKDVMDGQGVVGVSVPESDFVSNAELSSPASWLLILQRLTSPPSSGPGAGAHGNGIDSVRVLPSGTELSQNEDNKITVTNDLAFEVIVKNSGENQETQVKVTLTIQQSPTPIKKEATIQVINPGETQTVTFSDLGSPEFGPVIPVKVTIDPVQGEKNVANNTAEYPCIFTLE
jgi:CARDB